MWIGSILGITPVFDSQCRASTDHCHPRLRTRCSQEALTPLDPQSLAALLTHPDSGGVFQLHQDRTHSSRRSSSFGVDLDANALRRMAARGLAEAVAAAWPGEGPLPRLRRAAAELLARAVGPAAGPAGEHSMSGTDLGHELSRQLGEDYRAAVGSVPGKKLLTALADDSDGQGLIKCDAKVGARCKVREQCRAWPVPWDGVLGGTLT